MTDMPSQLDSIRKGLATSPKDLDTSELLPMFVPSAFLSLGNWPGPYTRLRAPDIALTWVVLTPNDTMLYVNRDAAAYWDEEGLDWRGLALRNLQERTEENPGSHGLRRADGALYALVMMQPDAMGPSRLLLRDRLSNIFASGYRVALPEMSCALAFSADVDAAEMKKLQGMVDNCYRDGTRPLANGVFNADDLLPAEDPA